MLGAAYVDDLLREQPLCLVQPMLTLHSGNSVFEESVASQFGFLQDSLPGLAGVQPPGVTGNTFLSERLHL